MPDGNRRSPRVDNGGITPTQIADIEGTAATAGVLLLVLLVALRIASPTRFREAQEQVAGYGPALGGLVAVIATVGSLWYSEGAHFPPCELCWHQRIAMYPLAVMLPLAALRRDHAVRPYAIAIAVVGLAVSAWHNLLETIPDLDPGGCDPTNPCTIRWVEGLGVWTIPRMAFVSFALVIATLLIDRPAPHLPEEP